MAAHHKSHHKKHKHTGHHKGHHHHHTNHHKANTQKNQRQYTLWETFTYRLRKSWRNIYFKSSIFLFVFCLTLLLLIEGVMHPFYAASMFIAITVAGLIFYRGGTSKLFWIMALFVALAYLMYVINPLAFWVILVFLIIGGVCLVVFIMRNIMTFIENSAKVGGMGFGGLFGGVGGFHLANKLFGNNKGHHK